MGVCYILKSTFLSFMSCFHTIRFSYEGCTIYVHYYSSLFNGRIHTNIHLFIHVIQSLLFSLFFLCMLVRILSSKIYFLCFFLASLHIALIYYLYKTNKEIKNLILLLLQLLLSSTSALLKWVCVTNEEHYTSIYIHPFT